MKKFILLLVSLLIVFAIKAQNKSINNIGISIPIIWNNSSGVYYQLGTRKEPEGKSVSNGININYSRTFYKKFYGTVGVGYFNQNFNISRPFDFNDPNNLLFSSKSYSYKSLNFNIGAGYYFPLNSKFSLKNSVVFNQISSYKQNYVPKFLSNSSFQTSQTNNKFLNIGRMINYDLGIDYIINNKFSLGLSLIVPLSIKWKNDNTFFEYSYSNDTQKIAYNKSSIGTLITINSLALRLKNN
jgi:hypothetical protein